MSRLNRAVPVLFVWTLLAPSILYSAQGAAAGLPRAASAAPRIQPVVETDWTEEQRALAAMFARAAPANDFRTFLVHPALVRGVMPFANYIARESMLSARHRALLVMRTAWLARSEYMWAKHAEDARAAGLEREDLGRVASAPLSSAWSPLERALLRAADELHHASFVSDGTWTALSAGYGTEALMDAVFTVAEITMLAMTVNSVGVPRDASFTTAMPQDGSRPTGPRTHAPLASPRIPALEPSDWSPAVRQMLDPSGSGRPVAAVYRTFARHERLYPPRQVLSEYIRQKNTLAPRVRELLILRIGYLCGSEYEWAAHARAGRAAGLTPVEIERLARPAGYDGWSPEDALLVRAVDELYARDTIEDDTWAGLARGLSSAQLLDLLITTGGYRMVSMALNTFGVALEPNGERFPAPPAARR